MVFPCAKATWIFIIRINFQDQNPERSLSNKPFSSLFASNPSCPCCDQVAATVPVDATLKVTLDDDEEDEPMGDGSPEASATPQRAFLWTVGTQPPVVVCRAAT